MGANSSLNVGGSAQSGHSSGPISEDAFFSILREGYEAELKKDFSFGEKLIYAVKELPRLQKKYPVEYQNYYEIWLIRTVENAIEIATETHALTQDQYIGIQLLTLEELENQTVELINAIREICGKGAITVEETRDQKAWLTKEMDKIISTRALTTVPNATEKYARTYLATVTNPSPNQLWKFQSQYDREKFALEFTACMPNLPNDQLNKRYKKIQRLLAAKAMKTAEQATFGGLDSVDLRAIAYSLEALKEGRPMDAAKLISVQLLDAAYGNARLAICIVDALDIPGDYITSRLKRCFLSILDDPLSFKKNFNETADAVKNISKDAFNNYVEVSEYLYRPDKAFRKALHDIDKSGQYAWDSIKSLKNAFKSLITTNPGDYIEATNPFKRIKLHHVGI